MLAPCASFIDVEEVEKPGFIGIVDRAARRRGFPAPPRALIAIMEPDG